MSTRTDITPNPVVFAARLGLSRGWSEFRQSLTHSQDVGFNITVTVAFAVVLYFQRNSTVDGTDQSLAAMTLPSMLGMMIAFGGLFGTAGKLAVEREDGTLLRAKAVPHGMTGYLVSLAVLVFLTGIVTLVIILVAGVFFVPGLAATGLSGWLTFGLVYVLGLLATVPIGAVLGSLATSPNTAFGLACCPWPALPRSPASSIRSSPCPDGSRSSRSASPSTGWRWEPGRRSFPIPRPPLRSASPGGISRPWVC